MEAGNPLFAIKHYNKTMSTFLALAGLGLIFWTFLEYILHRFVFHRFRGILGSFHHEHHGAPRSPEFLFVRPVYAIGISALLAAGVWFITGSMLQTAGLMSGIWAGFVYYESVHYRVHMTASEGAVISRQRRAHFRHHFHDARRRFGVTTPIWDYVFRTA
jgi:sterol desaturase/sphingolipid hydroxylase (fatty acid hydroxylase superfamily)